MTISRAEVVLARDALLQRTAAFFSEQADVVGLFVAGSLPAGTADAFSDIDLRVIATPQGHASLVAERLALPSRWGDLLFNEWVEGAQHCVSHFRPFLKLDVFYLRSDAFLPSPWLKFPATVLLDREGLIRNALERSAGLRFPPIPAHEVSRVLSKALAGAHEVVRRARRGEPLYAQSLLEELRLNMIRLDDWLHAFDPITLADLKVDLRVAPVLRQALNNSYVHLDADALDAAVIGLAEVLVAQIPQLHAVFGLTRSLDNDLYAAELVRARMVA